MNAGAATLNQQRTNSKTQFYAITSVPVVMVFKTVEEYGASTSGRLETASSPTNEKENDVFGLFFWIFL